ncbi:MAG: hypothetical protein ACK53V_11880, partial [Planctomycetota bacterium]
TKLSDAVRPIRTTWNSVRKNAQNLHLASLLIFQDIVPFNQPFFRMDAKLFSRYFGGICKADSASLAVNDHVCNSNVSVLLRRG